MTPSALNRFELLKKSDKLKTEQDIESLLSEKEFDEFIKILSSEFIWCAGKYSVTFEFKSPHNFNYKRSEYTFNLNQDDIDNLRKNINNVQLDMLQTAKKNVIVDYKPKEEFNWVWRNPELQRSE